MYKSNACYTKKEWRSENSIKMIQGEFVQEYVFKLKYFLQLTFQKINRHKFLLFFFCLYTCSICHLAGIAC